MYLAARLEHVPGFRSGFGLNRQFRSRVIVRSHPLSGLTRPKTRLQTAIYVVRIQDTDELFSPFLQFVSSTDTFDQQFQSYLTTSYVQEK